MIDKEELKQVLAEIEADKLVELEAERIKDEQESETRRIDAISYIEKLPLEVDLKLSLPEQKQSYYNNIESLKTEIGKAETTELKVMLFKRINLELKKINEIKDQQRQIKEVDVIGT